MDGSDTFIVEDSTFSQSEAGVSEWGSQCSQLPAWCCWRWLQVQHSAVLRGGVMD